MGGGGGEGVGLDGAGRLEVARQTVAGRAALQGNLDPATLYGSHETIVKATKAMLDDAYAVVDTTVYVANLGHGITPWVDPKNPKAFIDTVHEYSAKYL